MTMDKITIRTVSNPDGSTTDHVIIDHGNNEFTSMTKSVYDTLASELSNPSTPQAGE